MKRAAFLPWPTPTVTVRSEGTMSPPAKTPGHPVIIELETMTVPSALNSTPVNPAASAWRAVSGEGVPKGLA